MCLFDEVAFPQFSPTPLSLLTSCKINLNFQFKTEKGGVDREGGWGVEQEIGELVAKRIRRCAHKALEYAGPSNCYFVSENCTMVFNKRIHIVDLNIIR